MHFVYFQLLSFPFLNAYYRVTTGADLTEVVSATKRQNASMNGEQSVVTRFHMALENPYQHHGEDNLIFDQSVTGLFII